MEEPPPDAAPPPDTTSPTDWQTDDHPAEADDAHPCEEDPSPPGFYPGHGEDPSQDHRLQHNLSISTAPGADEAYGTGSPPGFYPGHGETRPLVLQHQSTNQPIHSNNQARATNTLSGFYPDNREVPAQACSGEIQPTKTPPSKNENKTKPITLTQRFSSMELLTAPADETPTEISTHEEKMLLDEEPDDACDIPMTDAPAEHVSRSRQSSPPIAEGGPATSERPLPTSVRCLEKHPFQQYYGRTPECQSTDPVIKLAVLMTLDDVHAFRNKSVAPARKIVEKDCTTRSEVLGAKQAELEGITERPTEAGALYVLQDSDGLEWSALPYHREVVANDRPDLHMLYMDNFSTDLANPNHRPHPNNYYPGDVIYVTEIAPRPGAGSIKDNFQDIQLHSNHRFWKVKKFYLVLREINSDVLVSKIQRSRNGKKKISCIAAGFNVITTARKTAFTQANSNDNVTGKRFAKLLVPKLSPGQLISSILPGKAKLTVIKLTRSHATDSPATPHIMSVQPIRSKRILETFTPGPPFKKFKNNSPQCYQALITTAHLGYSGVLAMTNKDKDLRLHPSIVDMVTKAQGKPTITFKLSNPSGPLRVSQWTRSTSIKVDVGGKRNLDMEVECAAPEGPHLAVTATPASSKPDDARIAEGLTGTSIIVSQKREENAYHLADFPNATDYEKIPNDGIGARMRKVEGADASLLIASSEFKVQLGVGERKEALYLFSQVCTDHAELVMSGGKMDEEWKQAAEELKREVMERRKRRLPRRISSWGQGKDGGPGATMSFETALRRRGRSVSTGARFVGEREDAGAREENSKGRHNNDHTSGAIRGELSGVAEYWSGALKTTTYQCARSRSGETGRESTDTADFVGAGDIRVAGPFDRIHGTRRAGPRSSCETEDGVGGGTAHEEKTGRGTRTRRSEHVHCQHPYTISSLTASF
uniref:Uncharacterized protein n=1 Tax=Caenorhabditis japonica TaxID=281687 RepID=A0A8R1E4T2_CAEJA